MKILILGAKGMLGHGLMEVFSDLEPIGWDIDPPPLVKGGGVDITDKSSTSKKISDLGPDIVINAAAYTNVDASETKKELAMEVNGEAVEYLAEICAKLGTILVHYSTDYVFDGRKREGYTENEIPKNPVNIYGQSKLLGEKKISNFKLQNSNFKFYLIRTSWLFGPYGKNFAGTILNLSKTRDKIKVVNDQWGKPTYTLDLARATRKIIEEKYPSGVYHLTNEGVCSWYEFAKEIVRLVGLKTKVLPCKSEEFPRPAKRPHYSILLNTKLPPMRSWQEALKEYLKIKN